MKLKNIMLRFCAKFFAGITAAFTAQAETCTTNGVTWTYTPDSAAGTAFVTGVSCSGVQNLEIPYSLDGYVVTALDSWLLYSDSTVKSVEIPSCVSSIPVDSFAGFTALESYIVADENECYSSVDGLLLSDGGKRLVSCPCTRDSVTIPETVETIGQYSFRGCTAITTIAIPAAVTDIEKYAFFSASSSLVSFSVDEGNATYCAVDGCILTRDCKTFVYCPPAAKSVRIPDGVTAIAPYAFAACYGIASVVIPESVTTIGEYAFTRCSCLEAIKFFGDAPASVGENVFYWMNADCLGYVLEGAQGWPEVGSEWNGLTIARLETTKDIVDYDVGYEAGLPGNTVYRPGVTITVTPAEGSVFTQSDIAQLASSVEILPRDSAQALEYFKVVYSLDVDGNAVISIELDLEVLEFDAATAELLEKVIAAGEGESEIVLEKAKEGFWYGLYTADTVDGLGSAEKASARATSSGVSFTIEKGAGSSMFCKLTVSDVE